ncbi:MAG: NAD(P)-dependent oxidoreductase [Rhodospirillales bacterium]
MAACIVVPDDFPRYFGGTAAEARLRTLGEVTLYDSAAAGADELIRRAKDADVAVAVYTKIGWTDAVLAACPRLRLISRCGTGLDGIDLEACRRRGVAVAHLVANDADEVAEHAIALALCALRRIGEVDRAIRAGRWDMAPIRGARGLTMGVVGLGAIGSRTAALARAIGMNVLAWSHGLDGGRAARAGAAWAELDDLLGRADVVSLHLRLGPGTMGLIDARRLGLMKRDAVLVNTARAGLVDRAALIGALSDKRIAAAALDVFHAEPLPQDDPLIALPNVVLTPHDGGNIAAVAVRGLMRAVENVANFLAGAPSGLAVDPGPRIGAGESASRWPWR